jgi:hypothetical protein
MAKQFLTGLDLNKNELLNARIQNLSSAPSSPVAGQIYYNTTDQTLRYYDGTGSAWVSLAIGGSVSEAITAAIDALDTDDIEEGSNNLYYTDARVDTYVSGSMSTDDLSEGATNLYFTDERAQDAIGTAITGGTQTNIAVTYDDANGVYNFVAENGVADSDTDDLSEGATNLYYTDARARGAVSSGDDYIAYNSGTGVFTLDTANAATVAYVDQEVSDVNNTINGLSTNDITEGSNLYYTDARARLAVASGDDTLSYNSSTGVFTANTSTLALKSYVDSQVQASAQGLDVKQSVRAATTANITLSGTQTIDGVSLVAGDRVLVKNQTTGSENGLYVVVDGGSWTRTTDADSDSEVTAGLFTFVTEGTSYADTGWVISTNDDITVGTTAITFTQFSGAGVISAGDGLVQNGTVFDIVGTSDRITVNSDSIDIAATYVGQSTITTVGTITTGTWNGTTIDVSYGGTGVTSLASGEYVLGNGTGGLTTSATIPVADLSGTLAVNQGGTGATTAAGARSNLGATTKYAASNAELTPSSGSVTWTVSHNLNTADTVVSVRELAGDSVVEVDVTHTDANTITLAWNSAATVAANSYRVVVIG